MKWTIIICLAGLISAPVWAGQLPSGDVAWMVEYLAEALPENSTPVWTESYNWGYREPHGERSCDGDVVAIWTWTSAGIQCWSLGPPFWAGDTDSTIEFRVRVPEVVSGQTYAAQLFIGFPRGPNADLRWSVWLGPDRVGESDGTESYFVVLTQWRRFRVLIRTIDGGPAGSLELYDLDSQDPTTPVIVDTSAQAISSTNILFGDCYSGSIGGRTELDYIAWTNAGAFLPELSNKSPESCQDVWAAGLGCIADVNHDCYVDLLDFVLLAQNWLRTW